MASSPSDAEKAIDGETVVSSSGFDALLFGFVSIRSQCIQRRQFADLHALSEASAIYTGQTLWLRGNIQESRCKGSIGFILVRHRGETIQAVLDSKTFSTGKAIIKWTANLPLESVIDIFGTFTSAASPVKSASIQTNEIMVHKLFCVNKGKPELPFQLKDASAPDTDEKAIHVGQDVRLDHRVMDLRTSANHAIFKLQARIGQYFRDYLTSQGFTEIHTPKLLSGFAEGGSTVFKVKYFDQNACLAQSPQLHKQMAICGGFDRVFEITPVFRAENSNTHRHLCEFTGLDIEMAIYEHYDEVLQVLNQTMKFIFNQLMTSCHSLIQRIAKQHSIAPFEWSTETPILTFVEAIELLREHHVEGIPDDISAFDFPTDMEKTLGQIIKQKYNTDFYMITEYPLKVRPFYTMPHPSKPEFSNSFDLFMRGEEITSGAQRIHEIDLLEERATQFGLDLKIIDAYLDAMRYGAPPHAGAGIGLERVLMLFLGLNNIRKASLFPRDPKRLSP